MKGPFAGESKVGRETVPFLRSLPVALDCSEILGSARYIGERWGKNRGFLFAGSSTNEAGRVPQLKSIEDFCGHSEFIIPLKLIWLRPTGKIHEV